MPKVSYVATEDKSSGKEEIQEPIKSEPIPIPSRKKIITDETPLPEEDLDDLYASSEEEDLEPIKPARRAPKPKPKPKAKKGKKKVTIAELSLIGAAVAAAVYLLRG